VPGYVAVVAAFSDDDSRRQAKNPAFAYVENRVLGSKSHRPRGAPSSARVQRAAKHA
jgi:hypothetical protein